MSGDGATHDKLVGDVLKSLASKVDVIVLAQASMARVVDALGGVTVCTPVPINDPKTGLNLAAGTHELQGAQALGYARTRATARSDLDRIDRQQQVVSALMDRALSAGTLANPARLAAFVNSTLRTIKVDPDDGLIPLASQLRDVSLDDVRKVAVPVLRHRISTNFQAQAEGLTTENIIARLIDEVPEPNVPKYE